MSFLLTMDRIRDKTKTVTRRLGWKHAKAGDLLWAVNRCQGLKRGERRLKICLIRVVSVRREPLSSITALDVEKEGYPGMSADEFIDRFAAWQGIDRDAQVTRIEFEYVEDADD